MTLNNCVEVYIKELTDKWELIANTTTVFAYDLSVTEKRFLEGEHQLYVELNPERSLLRRAPETIDSLNPIFDEEKFNFKQVQPAEIIMTIPYKEITVSMLINKSPLTKYHTLICPDLNAGHPQRLTIASLRFVVEFMKQLKDRSFRVGYNSPGALASVNHLHLHLLHITVDLYIDKVPLIPLWEEQVFRIGNMAPTEAICFIIRKSDMQQEVDLKLNRLYDFILWLCEQNLPHNLFITPSRENDAEDTLKIFVFVREKYVKVKSTTIFNIGFCELSGYIPVGDKDSYEKITEQQVLTRIRAETGDVFEYVYQYFRK